MFYNERGIVILCVKVTIVIKIRYKYENMRFSKKAADGFSVLGLMCSLSQHIVHIVKLTKTLLKNEQVTTILCVKRAIFISIRYKFDRMRCSDKNPRYSMF